MGRRRRSHSLPADARIPPLPVLTERFPVWECISVHLPCGVSAPKLVHTSPCRQAERLHPCVPGLQTELSVCPTCLEKQECHILRIRALVPSRFLLALGGGPVGCSWQRCGAASCRATGFAPQTRVHQHPKNGTAVRGVPSSASRVVLLAHGKPLSIQIA